MQLAQPGGFLNMTQSVLPPIGQTTLGSFNGVAAPGLQTTNPNAFMSQKANSTTTSLLDTTQM